MVDRFRFSRGDLARFSRSRYSYVFHVLSLAVLVGTSGVLAQTPSAATYPVNPAASAGMSTGGANTTTARDMQMMQVRSDAQSAQGAAVAASMARSADRTIDQQNQDRVLQMAREEKAIKRQMAERMKWERANASRVDKVSANDMSSWQSNGGVRVERNVPDPFITALIQEERQLAAQEAAANEKEPGFGPFGKLNPFKKNRAPETHVPGLVEAIMESEPQPVAQTASSGFENSPQMPAEDSGGGFFSKLKPPRIGRREEAPIDASSAEPQFVQTSSSRSSSPPPAPAASMKPGTIPRISGAALVDGTSPVNSGAQASAPAPQPQVQQSTVSFAEEMPDTSQERGGFFSKLKSGGNSGGGLFSFGKKKSSQSDDGTIDASLFPAGAVAQSPTGGSLGGGYTSADVAEDVAAMPASATTVQLPGAEPEKRSSGFSFKPPKINIPKPSISGGGGGGDVPTMTTVNSQGNSYYVIASTAQIMIYGENQMQSEIRALPAGMVVQMTKPGETWAGVRLSNGTEGIVQNKFLRAASASEVGAQFAPAN